MAESRGFDTVNNVNIVRTYGWFYVDRILWYIPQDWTIPRYTTVQNIWRYPALAVEKVASERKLSLLRAVKENLNSQYHGAAIANNSCIFDLIILATATLYNASLQREFGNMDKTIMFFRSFPTL